MNYNSAQFVWDMARESVKLEDFKEKVTFMLWEVYQDAVFDENDHNAPTKIPRPVDLQVTFDFPDDSGKARAIVLELATNAEPIVLGRFIFECERAVPLPPAEDPHLRVV